MNKTRRLLLLTSITLYSLAVFCADFFTPLGIEVWVLNVPVILVPIVFRSSRMVVLATLACSVMVVVDSLFSSPGSNPRSWDVLNRGMGLGIMWLIAIMACHVIRKTMQLDSALETLRGEIAQHYDTGRALVQSEERLRLAMEGANMGIYDVNLPMGTVTCSATHLRMLGYKAESDGEFPMDMWHSWVYPDDQARVKKAREQSMRNHTLYSVEYRIQRADNGEIRWLTVFGCSHYNAIGQAIRFVAVSFDITWRKELEREIRQKELAGTILEMTDREQRHIGQELHDGVGQELTGLGLMAQTLAQQLPITSPEQRIANRLVAGFHELHQQIRELARGLLPVEVESKGLWAALDDLATTRTEQTGISVKFECPEWVELPDHATSMELYRISQEALSNALRHGRPRTIRLTILSQPDGLRLRIKDDGVGIPNQPNRSKGLGIRIMEYRTALIGGVLLIKSAEEGGTVVTVTLPRSKVYDHEEIGIAAGAGKNTDCG